MPGADRPCCVAGSRRGATREVRGGEANGLERSREGASERSRAAEGLEALPWTRWLVR
jgi:hypothetical protein